MVAEDHEHDRRHEMRQATHRFSETGNRVGINLVHLENLASYRHDLSNEGEQILLLDHCRSFRLRRNHLYAERLLCHKKRNVEAKMPR
jgi:hypothetical protein